MTCAELEVVLEEQLRGATAGSVQEHLGGCPACAARLERRRAALAALDGTRRPAPPPELRGRIGAELARRRRFSLLGGSGAVALVAAAAAVLLWPRPPTGLVARGGADAPPVAAVQLALLCYDAADAAPDPSGHCRIDQLAGLALRRPPDTPAHLAVIGFQGAEPRYYFPTPGDARNRAAAAGPQLQPVGPLFRLAVNHRAGPLRLVGVLSPRPLALAELESAVRGQLPPGAVLTETTVTLREARP